MCSQSMMNQGHRLRHAVESNRVVRRKFMKHMVEKRRRNRINDCLENMRTMVLSQMGKNPTNYSKMEKADILEMTVKFVETLKKKPSQMANTAAGSASASSSAPTQMDFHRGYNACREEVSQFLDVAAFPQEMKSRLNQHLTSKHSPSSSASTSSRCASASPNLIHQPRVINPHDFTAMQYHHHNQAHAAHLGGHHLSPLLTPGAHHPNYLEATAAAASQASTHRAQLASYHHRHHHQALTAHSSTSSSSHALEGLRTGAASTTLCQPLSIDIKPEPAAVRVPMVQGGVGAASGVGGEEHVVDNAAALRAQRHAPDNHGDEEVWRPW